MPHGQQYATNMAQLMIASGNAQAEAARRKGEIWGSTMASLGQIPQQVQQMRQQRTRDAMQADAYGRQRDIDTLTLQEKQAAADKRKRIEQALTSAPDIPSAVTALARIDPEAALALENDLLTTGAKRIEAVARVAPQVKDQTSHMAKRQELAALGIQVPLTYTPEWWETQATAVLSYKDQLDLLRQQAQDRQAENQRGVRRMLGEAVVQRGGQPLDTATRQTMEGMALQEGVTLPTSLTRQDPSVSYQSDTVLLDGRPERVGYNPKANTYIFRGQDVTARVRPLTDRQGSADMRDSPRLPRGVENYIAGLKGRGYDRTRAEKEVFADQTWASLRRDHPRISAVDVQQAIARLFPDDLGVGTVFGGVGATPGGRGAGGGPGPAGARGRAVGPGPAGGAVTVDTPGGPFTFPNQQAADQFRRAAGLP